MDDLNPLLHPDILPLILAFSPDRTLAALMRCSRSHLSAVIHSRYPHIVLDPTAAATSRPNTARRDLPVDAKWFSAPFKAYVARYARVVGVKGHAAWSCPPKGMMLGVSAVRADNGDRGAGLPDATLGKGKEKSSEGEVGKGLSRNSEGTVEISTLRLEMHGVCRPISHSTCAILGFFRPHTTVVPAFMSSDELLVASSISIPASTRRLVVEVDLLQWTDSDHQLGKPNFGNYSHNRLSLTAMLPEGIPLGAIVPTAVQEVVLCVLPTALYMKRSDQPVYTTFLKVISDFIASSAKAIHDFGGSRTDDEEEEAGNGSSSREYTIIGLGQLNPSWASKKVWDETVLESLVLADIYASLSEVAPDLVRLQASGDEDHDMDNHDDTEPHTARPIKAILRAQSSLVYLSSPTTKAETPLELHSTRTRQASAQAQAVLAAGRKAKGRERERAEDAKRRKVGALPEYAGPGQVVEGGGHGGGAGQTMPSMGNELDASGAVDAAGSVSTSAVGLSASAGDAGGW